jgi:ethanolamine-phosphate cytidylyltransferase
MSDVTIVCNNLLSPTSLSVNDGEVYALTPSPYPSPSPTGSPVSPFENGKRGSLSVEHFAELEAQPEPKKKKQVRVWVDGCFDLMHYGHANALRQARLEGDYLIVGVHTDEEIRRHKGPPVMNEQERYAAVRACKWVDEVVEGAPYVTSLAMLDQYNVDFCLHGEDMSYDENGRDSYWEVKQAGRFQHLKRTQGVSTTDLVGRMLLMTKDHLPPSVKASTHQPIDKNDSKHMCSAKDVESSQEFKDLTKSVSSCCHFIPSTLTLSQFASGSRSPTEKDVVVYIDGAFDLFHVGHVEALRVAKSFGTYVIVGIHDDAIVNQMKGGNQPILSVYERTLGVLQCRYADEVITGAPWQLTEQVIRQLKISVVVHGTTSDYVDTESDPYSVPKKLGIYKEFASPHADMTTSTIIERIVANSNKFLERNKKKVKGELAFAKQVADAYQEHTAKVSQLAQQ